MKLEKGDRVRIKETGEIGTVVMVFIDNTVSFMLDGGYPAEYCAESLEKISRKRKK